MRLIIAFDINFQYHATDVVIAKSKPSNVNDSQFIKVDALTTIDYVDTLEKVKEKLISNYQSKIVKGAIYSSINNFNRNWILPLFKWIDTIELALAKHNFDEIIIVGYTKHIGYLPYYEAEGEIGSQLLYKDYDVIPALIEKYFSEKEIKVKIEQKKSVIKLRLRIFIRRYVLLVYKVFAFLLKKFKTRKFKTHPIDFKTIKFLFSTRSIAHSEYMYNFFNAYNKETIVHVNDGIHAGNKNLNFIDKQGYKNVSTLYKTVSTRKVVFVFFVILKAVLQVKKDSSINVRGITMNISSSIIEMLISYFDALIYKESILTTIKDNKVILVTGEMYTPYAYVVSEIGKETGNLTVQLQTTAMMVRREPNFVYCDKFLMNSKANSKAFKKLYPKNSNYIDYYGSLLYNEKNSETIEDRRELKKLIYFTQPLIEEDIEFKIIDKLIELESTYNYKTYIKLHPRERTNKLDRYNNSLNVIDNNLIFKEYIADFDLAVIRNTSLGSSIILEGVPIITCLLSKSAQNSKMDYINKDYYGTIFFIDELQGKIENFERLKNEFINYREDYVKVNDLTKGIHNFYNSI